MTELEPSILDETKDTTTLETKPPDDPMYCTQYQFHKITGISKVTIKRHVDAGKIQLHSRADGRRLLFVPEAMNFYQDRIKKDSEVTVTNIELGNVTKLEPGKTYNNQVSEPVELISKLAAADMEIKYLKEMLEGERERRVKAEREQDRWHTAYEELKMLPAPAAQPAANTYARAFPKARFVG